MMKKLCFILICVGFISNAQVQHEDFNSKNIPDGWSATKSESGCSWEFGYTGALIGSGIQNPASFQSGGVIFSDTKCGDFKNNYLELISPTINLIEKRLVTAKIEITYNLQTFSGDGIFKVHVWDGKIWQSILTVSEDTNENNSGENQTRSLDVSQFINSNFKVRFSYDDQNSLTWGVGIDDYKLTGEKDSGIPGLENLAFSYYPNPIFNDNLTLHSNKIISVVNIYNAIGQRVVFEKPVSLDYKLNLQHLSSGTYVVQILIADQKGSFKIIKQ